MGESLQAEGNAGSAVAPPLSIVVVNWRSAADLAACLESVRRETPEGLFEVIVVDNASFDGCAEMLATRYPDVRFIQARENLGFARANNLGATAARIACSFSEGCGAKGGKNEPTLWVSRRSA